MNWKKVDSDPNLKQEFNNKLNEYLENREVNYTNQKDGIKHAFEALNL